MGNIIVAGGEILWDVEIKVELAAHHPGYRHGREALLDVFLFASDEEAAAWSAIAVARAMPFSAVSLKAVVHPAEPGAPPAADGNIREAAERGLSWYLRVIDPRIPPGSPPRIFYRGDSPPRTI